jgi:hypothetical protein
MYVLDVVKNIITYSVTEFNVPGLRSAILVTAPWSAESRSNRVGFWFLMRVQTGIHHDPIGYGLARSYGNKTCTPS